MWLFLQAATLCIAFYPSITTLPVPYWQLMILLALAFLAGSVLLDGRRPHQVFLSRAMPHI